VKLRLGNKKVPAFTTTQPNAGFAPLRNVFRDDPVKDARRPRDQRIDQENFMATKKKSRSSKKSSRKYGKAAGKTVASAMRRKKKGTLRSGKGGKGGAVKSRKQAIAIGLSEARKKGAKVPPKRTA
jgi:hypothetical protein